MGLHDSVGGKHRRRYVAVPADRLSLVDRCSLLDVGCPCSWSVAHGPLLITCALRAYVPFYPLSVVSCGLIRRFTSCLRASSLKAFVLGRVASNFTINVTNLEFVPFCDIL